MKLITTMAFCALLTSASQSIAQEQTQQRQGGQQGQLGQQGQSPGLTSENTETLKATVQKVDKETREVTLKGEGGNMVTVKVPEAARNFDQIKPGDIVTAKYTQSMAIAVRKSDEPPSATGRESITRAPLGERPAAQRTATMQINARVEKIDRDKRELTLLGPRGNTRVVKVAPDVQKFDELKEGDQVVVNATESIAISVSSPEK